MADTLDVVTLAEAKAALGITTNTYDAVLPGLITAASRREDAYAGPVVVRAVTEVHDGGFMSIILDQPPVSSVTTVKEYSSGSLTTLAAEVYTTAGTEMDYRVDLTTGEVKRRASGADTWFGSGRVEIVYVAGRYATTAAVDPLFKQVAYELIERGLHSEPSVKSESIGDYSVTYGERPEEDILSSLPRFVTVA